MASVITDRTVTVLGAGESGRAAARWLAGQGARVTVSDRRLLHEWKEDFVAWCRGKGVKIEAGGHSEYVCTLCDILVASPGIPSGAAPLKAAMNAGVTVVNDLVLAACFWKGPIVAITGTNGKTTATMLTVHLLENSGIKAVAAGNISPPLFKVMEDNARDTTAVLEVSSFQMELLEREWRLPFTKPCISVAVWLNLAPDHIDRHGDMDHYGACKARLLQLQDPHGHAVLNADDKNLLPWRHEGGGRRFWYGRQRHSPRDPCAWFNKDETKLFVDLAGAEEPGLGKEQYDLSAWGLAGRHNLENLAAAVAAARLSGASTRDIQRSLSAFRAPPHRFETVALVNGITYINDSKATNVAAALGAVSSSPGPVVLIAGGQGKDEDYLPLAQNLERLARHGMLKAVLLMGHDAQIISNTLCGFKKIREIIKVIPGVDNGRAIMKKAVEKAVFMASPGDVVLLSPACASFDMFPDYRQRGRAFRDAVAEITEIQGRSDNALAA